MNRGIIYVAWGERHVLHAIESAKTSPYPTALITSTPEFAGNHFDHLIVRDFNEYARMSVMYRKMEAFLYSPFENSLFLDVDTSIIGNIDLGFRLSEKFGFSAVIASGMSFLWKDIEYVHFNGGVVFFKGKPIQWIDKVFEIQKEFSHDPCEEPVWSIAWEQTTFPAVLPFIYNCNFSGEVHQRDIRIWHSYRPIRTKIVNKAIDDASQLNAVDFVM